MSKICANFKITTPMFLGGADNQNTAELRPTSMKAALRFWFRAINYGKYQDYKKIKNVEDELFGSTTSQSRFILKLNSENIKAETNEVRISNLFNAPEIGYLGYGLFQRQKFYRPYLIPGQSFTVELLLKPKSKNRLDFENLIKPIIALGLFGGLGSRSRRGFGSVTLDSVYVDDKKPWTAPESREELGNAFKDFYSDLELSRDIPEYTAFSSNTRTIILDEFSDYKEALKSVGRAMMDFRRDCDKDTDIVLDALGGRDIDKHPDRVVFGLPHNYFIRGQGKVDINPVIGSGGTRRSSPLFIKIISIKENNNIKYVPIMTVFPSEFLPKGSKISLKSTRRSYTLDPKVSFDLINEFMDTFPNRLEVKALD
ncbi:MAG: type III-B CRISPR module RAMP protein Cmr1 [Tepidanaerobacteraceae bacterium]|jgi:CRISPR-associated protein Cmr1